MVHEVASSAEFQQLIGQKNKLVVVDFTATWCGPCKRIAPEFDALSRQHPDVLFLKVVESTCQDLIMQLGVRAFPTFHFYLDGNKIDEMSGADINALTQKVLQHKARVQPAFGGEGFSLGGGGAAVSAADARSARLARFGAAAASSGPSRGPDPETAARNARILAMAAAEEAGTSVTAKAAAAPAPMDVDPPAAAPADAAPAPPPAAAAADGASAASAMDLSGDAAAPLPAPTGPRALRAADPELVSQLVDMGFPEARAKKALMLGPGGDVESAINWLGGHQDDADIDEPVAEYDPSSAAAGGGESAQSLRCDDCGTLLRDMTAAELHAHKTGHSNFSESTAAVKPLSPEEKAAKLAAIKEKLAARRLVREAEEKVDHVAREKARRFTGKEATKTREEMEKQARKREADKIKKEKRDALAERERLRLELAKDKAERKARGGKLAGKLGVEGYAPSGMQGAYGDGPEPGSAPAAGDAAPAAAAPTAAAAPVAAPAAAPAAAAAASSGADEGDVPSLEKVEKAAQLLSRQLVGGEGGTAMKTALAYCRNALDKADDEKFRSISLDNKAYKTRVAGCMGGTALLRGAGFAKDDANGRLFMSMANRNEEVLRGAIATLEKAIEAYQPVIATVK